MNVGAPCIGCTMPGFPDSFSPFYRKPPGTLVSSSSSKVYGAVIRRLRAFSQFNLNRTRRWNEQGHVPSGWGHVREPNPIEKFGNSLYKRLQFAGTVRPGTRHGEGEGAKNGNADFSPAFFEDRPLVPPPTENGHA